MDYGYSFRKCLAERNEWRVALLRSWMLPVLCRCVFALIVTCSWRVPELAELGTNLVHKVHKANLFTEMIALHHWIATESFVVGYSTK
jgi:hypothetical protein